MGIIWVFDRSNEIFHIVQVSANTYSSDTKNQQVFMWNYSKLVYWYFTAGTINGTVSICQSSIVRCYSVYHCIPCFHHCVECTSFASWNHILCGGMWITIHFEYVHISYDSHRMAWYSRFWSHHTFLLNFNSLPFYLVLVILHLFVLQTTKQNVRLELCTKGNYNFLSYHNFSFEHFFSKYLF